MFSKHTFCLLSFKTCYLGPVRTQSEGEYFNIRLSDKCESTQK